MNTATKLRRIFALLLLPLVLTAPDLAAQVTAPGHTNAVIKTSMGEIHLELYPDRAPATVENFVRYAQDGFYDGTIFHRVISHFMIQGGGFTPDMQKKPTLDPIPNESNNGLSNRRGTVAMARLPQPHSATSQFFINVQNNLNLDYRGGDEWGYAVFGKVVQGMEVVDDIRYVQTSRKPPFSDVPVEPVIIESVTITED
jgi:cyclophilin family peptidyl-prolyl cis-trans isomerase